MKTTRLGEMLRRISRSDAAEMAAWIALGTAAAKAVRRTLGEDAELRRAPDVHRALEMLDGAPFAGVVVSARAIQDRPAAALGLLARRVGSRRVVLLSRGASKRVLQAAEAQGVRVWAAPERSSRPPPSRPARPSEPASPPPGDETAHAHLPLPRADDAPPQPALLDPGTFADGCLSRVADRQSLARFVLRALVEGSSAVRVSLMLLEPDRRALRVRQARGVNGDLVHRVRCPLGRGIAGRAAVLGRPMVGYGLQGGERGYTGSAYVILPLGQGDECEGVANLTGLPGDRLPDAETLERWGLVALQAGRALGLARRLARAESLSTTDAVTALPNRRAFEGALGRELDRASRSGDGLAVAIFDVDHFKAVNDTYGHQAGDVVLAEIAARLRRAFRDSDLVARWGGEEFAVLLTGLPRGGPQSVLGALERARLAIASRPVPLEAGLPPCRVTISCGVASYPERGVDASSVVRAADGALYRAKDAGRNTIRWE